MNLKKIKIWRAIAPHWKIHHRWLHNLKYLDFSEEDIKEIEREDEKESVAIKGLEEDWRKSQIYYSDKELLKIFPEAKEIIPEKIKECEKERKQLMTIIGKQLTLIKQKITDEFSQWFWREWVKTNEAEKVLKIDEHVARLKRLIQVSKGRLSTNRGVNQEQIQRAEISPIENIALRSGIKLRKIGKKLVGHCPFHQEKNPSFYIYPESNSFYCFGCQKGGNVIVFVKLLYGNSFPEAVKWLIGEK